ncbi:InlB B-repeat-containing protein [Candidatus Saccharibacteria bacterium]|nr:InlB B-repeat-containing protein [Candidatus Saccharibacteria bacterium]
MRRQCEVRRGGLFVRLLFGVLAMAFLPLVFGSHTVYAIATPSSLTLSVTDHELTADAQPGIFVLSESTTISVTTTNFTGYTLSVAATGANKLVSTNNDEIPSMTGSPISRSTYESNSTYNNTFGFRPSQYITTSNNVDTVVTSNTNFIPVPDSNGIDLDKTSVPNSTANQYTLEYGVKPGASQPAGTYTYEYVISAVGHESIYNITYNNNAGSDTVNSMPAPNPQAISVDAGTPAEDSYGKLSSALPTRDDYTFAGWCDETTTTDQYNNQICGGTTYQPGDNYEIDQTADGTNITLYAIWIDDAFPTVWSQMGKCIFDGSSNDTDDDPNYVPGNIHGTECSEHSGEKFIDTGIALYSATNYQKDYEVHFTIDRYVYGEQPDTQSTIFNDKLSSSVTGAPYGGKSPGIVVRKESTNNSFEIKSTYTTTPRNGDQIVTKTAEDGGFAGTDVRILRINGKIYTSLDNGPLELLQDMTNPAFTQQFGLTAWFGAYPDNVNCTEGCTAAKRFFEGELSNMYIKLGDFDEDNLHEVTFVNNDGTQDSTKYLILDGNAVSTFPTVSRQDWVFGGWWTATSSGEEKTAPFTPTGDITLYARWYKPVSEAQIVDDSINLDVNDTETIQVTNSAVLEPYTFTSSHPSIASVDASGVITGLGAGVATITMTGSITGTTKTIDVTVGSVIVVTFDPDYGTEATFTRNAADGGTLDALPDYSRSNYELEGWYTEQNGGGTKLTTSTVFGGTTPTYYYANWTEAVYVCKIATSRHSEKCKQSGSNGCRGASIAYDADIYYGRLVDSTTMTAGDAYNCDVNNDGDWDDETERFYYFGTENGNAKLVYFESLENSDQGWDNAIGYLPTSSTWTNPYLVSFTTGDYAGKVARFMSYSEASTLCGTSNLGVNGNCLYLLEKSAFANTNDSGYRDGIWLGKNGNNACRIQTRSRGLTNGGTQANTPRPTIEVPVAYMEPYVPSAYTITFDPHNETASWDETIDAGDDLTDVYPASDPTYTNHIFKGWYTAETGGTAISGSTQPSGSTTYHAQWRSVVDVAVIENDHLTVEEGSTVAINVTGPADLEDYSFTSNGTAIATVDSSTGVITGVAVGNTTITMTGADSNHTRTIYIDVTAQTPTTYTVYFNPHNGSPNSSATIAAGSTIGNNNIPADPTNSDPDQVFMGWFTDETGGTAVDATTTPSADGETYHAQWKKIVCKIETSSANLHSATKVSPNSGVPTYGQIANSSTPQSGDAYNCDVDYDDTYSSVNERFYYVGQDSNNNAVLVAWNSYYGGAWAPGTSGDTIYSYTDALGQLPAKTDEAWDNPGLIEQETGKAARFTSRAELASACNTTLSGLETTDVLLACDYFMEHAKYDGGGRSALWLMKEGSTQYRIHTDTGNRHVSTSTGTSMVRPTIVVPYKLIEKYTPTLLDVTHAIIANNDLTVPVGEHITVIVSNASELEPYTFSSADDTIATVDATTGVITGVNVGTTNIIMTGSNSGQTKTIEVDVLQAGSIQHRVTFNANGGTLDNGASTTRDVDDGDPVGTLPTASKTNYRFFGWYTDDGTFYREVYPEEQVTADVTYYAKWEEDTSSFPIVWAETNECTFTGSAVTGTHCGNTSSSIYYIDTAIQLFTAANYDKDFEVGFTITEYSPSSQLPSNQGGNQATFVSFKKEDSANNYPGFVIRRYSASNYIEITSRWKGDSASLTYNNFPSTTKTVKLVKRKETEQGVDYYRVYYSIDGGAWTPYEDVTNKTHFEFNTKVWFGGAAASNGTSPMRPLVGKMTDMYVKLGAQTDYVITFDANHGSLQSGEESRTITINDSVGTLPIPTPPDSNFTFVGWFDESVTPNVQITAATVPSGNKTYVAHYEYQSSDEPVEFDVSNEATRDYNTLINTWNQSPINISTFNEATPISNINNSTWGNTSELSEVQFWTGLKSSFEANGCLVPTYKDTATTTPNPTNWSSGSIDCSKPDAYDTKTGAALNVYLNNRQGEQVTYAKASSGIIHNMIPGQTYYWERADDSTVHGYVSAVSNTNYHTRWVDTGVIRNTRDLGGLPVTYTDSNNQTVTGTLAYGRLFRGEKLWTAPATELTNLGINKEYDVGDPAEYSGNTQLSDYANNRVIHYDFDYHTNDELDNESNYMRAWLAVTHIMTDITNTSSPKNIYFHCRIGSDRTGTVAYLLEGLLGVPDEARYQEYELTHLSGQWDRTRYYKLKSSSNAKKFVYMMNYVKTNANILAWYMHNPNADMNLVQAFRSAMTVTGGMGGGANNDNNASGQNNANSLSMLSNRPSNLNTTNAEPTSTSDSDNTSEDSGKSADSNDSYSDPLGVTKTAGSSTSGGNNDTATAFGLVAVGASVVAAGAAYSLIKHNSEDEG